MRPGEIPEGDAYTTAGRPGVAVLAVSAVVLVALALILWAVLR
jgi:hypothetical protein